MTIIKGLSRIKIKDPRIKLNKIEQKELEAFMELRVQEELEPFVKAMEKTIKEIDKVIKNRQKLAAEYQHKFIYG
jgi:hypothetical protein